MTGKSTHRIGRRAFLKGAAAVAAGSALGASFRADAESVFPPGRYVDIHTHLGQRWGFREILTVEKLLKWMDENDIAQAAVLPLISPEAWDHPLSTDYVLRETEPHRDRLFPFCSIDPRTLLLGGYAKKRDLLLKYKEAGAKGFGEHKPGVAIDDPRNIELFQASAEVGLPILFHLDNDRNMDQPGLPGLEKVLKEVPNGIFIGHANGFWASISGGITQADLSAYPKTPVQPGGALDRLMDAYPNLYGDLSAGSGSNAIERDLAFGREFIVRRADRLLFGTDYLAPAQQVMQLALYRTLDLPEAVQAKVFRDNARRLLGLL
ncbi:MAG: amidohydrolase family protein [Candidatus Hydrogenedentes bacterium]|nr:amidohydrolase family protein [Candidatus Hydrogenedentota bacterium]